MLVVGSGLALGKPDINHVENVVDGRVPDADFLVHDLAEFGLLVGEIGLAACAVYARFVELREGGLRGRVNPILDPEGGALVLHTKLLVQRLHHARVLLVVVPEVVRVLC